MTTSAAIHIIELLTKYEDALSEIGYSYTTRLLFLKQADLIVRRHENKGLEYIEPYVIAEYMWEIVQRYLQGKIQKRHFIGNFR